MHRPEPVRSTSREQDLAGKISYANTQTPSVEIVGSVLRKRFSETVEGVAYRSSNASFPGFPSQSVASAGASFFSVMFGQISESSALSSRKFS